MIERSDVSNANTALERLEKLASEATPGPWEIEELDAYSVTVIPSDPKGHDIFPETVSFHRSYERELANASWIAAANPETMKRLIRVIREQRAALEFYADKKHWDHWDIENMSPTIWDDGNIDLGNRARRALAETDELLRGLE